MCFARVAPESCAPTSSMLTWRLHHIPHLVHVRLLVPHAPACAWRVGALFASLPVGLRICRHVILPSDISKAMPKGRLLSEAEWRGLGVQQSRGWEHYAIHRPEPHILLFRRDKNGNY